MELIVVLVILAILAALLVPALTGYIDKAKKQSIIAETRQAVMAAQTLADEAYAKKNVGAEIKIATGTGDDVTKQQIADLAEVPVGNIGAVTMDGTNKSKIATLEYTKSGKTCTYTANPANGVDQYSVS